MLTLKHKQTSLKEKKEEKKREKRAVLQYYTTVISSHLSLLEEGGYVSHTQDSASHTLRVEWFKVLHSYRGQRECVCEKEW